MREYIIDLDGVGSVTAEMVANAKLLLELYKKVKYRVEDNVSQIDAELYIEDRKHLSEMLQEFVDFDTTLEKQKIQERLNSNSRSLCLLELMEDALARVRKYPDEGELLYNLLRYKYFDTLRNTNQNIMEKLDVSYSTYYRKMNRAIQLFSLLLLGIGHLKATELLVNQAATQPAS